MLRKRVTRFKQNRKKIDKNSGMFLKVFKQKKKKKGKKDGTFSMQYKKEDHILNSH